MNDQVNFSNTTLHTVIIFTQDMKKLADFYGRTLGLGEPEMTGSDHLGFSLPNAYLGFDQVKELPGDQPGSVSLWFEVEDLHAAFERMLQAGAKIRYPPTRKPWGAMLASLFDPDGNLIGISQRGAFPG